jgi:hypothetical protein
VIEHEANKQLLACPFCQYGYARLNPSLYVYREGFDSIEAVGYNGKIRQICHRRTGDGKILIVYDAQEVDGQVQDIQTFRYKYCAEIALWAFVELRGFKNDISSTYDLVLRRQPDPEDVGRIVANQVADQSS